MLTGNKGEWSEVYTLFKLLGDAVLYPGNENIERIANIFYPIVKILRSESNGDFEYSIEDNIVVISGNTQALKIPVTEFKTKSAALLNHIKTSASRTFAIPEIEEFMQEINCISLKANSSAKTDITIVIHDQRTNQTPTLGYIYNRNDFENYLINNTKLETASSSRHGFGEIYEESGELFFKLNLQIRFVK